MNNIRAKKYLVMPNSKMRKWELLCQTLSYIVIFVLAVVTRFVYREKNISGMSSIFHEPNSRLVAIIDKKTRFIPTQADFMPNPPSDTALILTKKEKTHQTVKFLKDHVRVTSKLLD
jgi:hypothetical protein